MREFCKQLPAKVSFLILVTNLFVFSTFGQNTQTPDCKKKFSQCQIFEYAKIIESNPSDSIAYFNRGVEYHKERKFDESFLDFSKAVEIDSKFAAAYSWRGSAYQLKKEYDLAIADYSKAIDLEPNDSNYFNRGSSYHSKNDHDKALADYNKAIELTPNDWLYRYVRGWLYYNNGKKLLAEADFKRAKELEKSIQNLQTIQIIKPSYPQFP